MGSRLGHNKGVWGFNRSSNSNVSCTQGPAPQTTTSPPLSPTNKGHYLPPLQVLPSLWRPLHSRSICATDISKTEFIIYLTWESYMCRKPDSLVSFYLIYLYIYFEIFILFWFVVLKDETTLTCNLLFGLIGHFGLLKDVNYIFLFFFLRKEII